LSSNKAISKSCSLLYECVGMSKGVKGGIMNPNEKIRILKAAH